MSESVRELRDQLSGAVGSAYRIGNELGGGGMSRVFMADDLALGRSVVIKVLHPELAAGVNVERFKREVQLAARLQHPHIVPVLSAGEVDGLPFYVMPFVKGESLQSRLARGPLPIADVVHVMGDVAKALAYAHSEGVVHRDIKPDNILVSGGAATVADFGIAKALSSSRRDENESLTTVGTSLGTAAYMAPEQVAGDPNLDHRADIYALGCVAYELLTGASPFAGKTPQQMLAAHVLEQPMPIRDKRSDTPTALADLVMRCMAKDPVDRPASGEAIIAALDDVRLGVNDSRVTGRPPARWGLIAGVAVLVAAVIVAGVMFRTRAGAGRQGAMIAVAPFEVLDPALGLWKEGLVDVLSRNLDGAASMHTLSPGAAIKRWEGRVGRDEAEAFARRTGSDIVVYGSLQPAGRDVVDAKVWILDTRSKAAPLELQARHSSARMDRLSDSLSVKLLAAIAGPRAEGGVRSLGSGSLPAVKAFLQGVQYFRHTRFDSAAVAFRQAVALDSTFAVAHAYLNQTLGWTQGSEADRIQEASAAARHLRGGLSPLDSLIVAGIAHYWDTTGSITANRRAAFAALGTATQRYPSDALAWYLSADLRFHADPGFSDQEAFHQFNRAIEADSDFAPSYIHAIEISNHFGADAARRYTRAYLVRAPGDREAEGLRLAMELSAPGATSDAKLRQLIDTSAPNVLQAAVSALVRLPDSAEAAIYLLNTAASRRDAQANPGYKVALIELLSERGHVAAAWDSAIVRKSHVAGDLIALGLIPADSAVKVMRPWLQTHGDPAFIALPALAAAHDTATLVTTIAAANKFASTMKAVRPRDRLGAQYFLAALHAYYQLARGDTASAAKEFDALPDSTIQVPADQFIRARLIGRSDPKRAIELLDSRRLQMGIMTVARELEIGRLAEKTGNTTRAVDAYAYVAGAWQNTDNDQLRGAVRESLDALKRLDADGRMRAQLVSPR